MDFAKRNIEGFTDVDCPTTCPHCQQTIDPRITDINFHNSPLISEIIFKCPNISCCRSYIGVYSRESNTDSPVFKEFVPNVTNDFSINISTLSPNFIEIYRQATVANSSGLGMIAGAGYKQALECLIKDYLTKHLGIKLVKNASKTEKNFLNDVCKNIKHESIKELIEQFFGVGKDTALDTQKWGDCDIDYFLSLITVMTNYIDMELAWAKISSDV
jgi:hypothetical protein